MQKTSDNIFILLLLSIGGVFLLVISFIVILIRNQNVLLKQKKKLDEAEIAHQKELLNAVIQYQEEERKRISEDLHDDVGGALSVLRMMIANHTEPRSHTDEQSMILMDRIIDDVRNISHSLSPQMFNLFGFREAIQALCDHMNSSSKIKLHFECPESVKTNLWDRQVSLAVFRIIQELIANTLKHAEAANIFLSFETANGTITINYMDDGQGLKPGLTKGMGMSNIKSRLQLIDATWEIKSRKNEGYRFKMNVPANFS
ncbi:hypothetical protein BH09BAC6_BH09BAC6_25230 [soil metagenome]|jgi:signal transduction histidine kinase